MDLKKVSGRLEVRSGCEIWEWLKGLLKGWLGGRHRGRVNLCALILACLLLAALLGGCKTGKNDPLAYQNGAFVAEIKGEMGKVEIMAEVTVSAQDPKSGVRQVTVEYLSPSVLSGLKLTAGLDQNANIVGNIEVQYSPADPSETGSEVLEKPFILSLEGDAAAELLRPARALIPQQPYAEIIRLEEGFRVTFSDGRVMETDEFGRPKQIISEQFLFHICFWN